VWQAGDDKAKFTLTGHAGGIRSLAVRDGGRWVLSGGADRTLRLWGTAAPKPEAAVFRKHAAAVTGAAFLANGTQTVSGDGALGVLPWKIDGFLATPAAPKTEKPKGPPPIPRADP
jgi:WD40 repeat protein